MHKSKILHRDLKPQNLLITNDNVLKICDFGLARGFGIPNKNYSHEVVTLWYRPPDVLLGSKTYMTSVDVWSIGCIFAEMCNGKALFTGSNEEDQLLKIFNLRGTPNLEIYPEIEELSMWNTQEFKIFSGEKISTLVPDLDSTGVDLLDKLLQVNPHKRITIDEALKHPFLEEFKNFNIK